VERELEKLDHRATPSACGASAVYSSRWAR
jgi:hypothetical protein